MTGDLFEIAIGAQELRFEIEARLSDHAVDCAADGHPLTAQGPEQACGSHVRVEGGMDASRIHQGSQIWCRGPSGYRPASAILFPPAGARRAGFACPEAA